MIRRPPIHTRTNAHVPITTLFRSIKDVEYTRPPLVPPGQTVQAALLFDPVATGVKEHDRRLPSTVMSALQITAEDERRDQFESTNLIEPDFSEGNRFLNITVGGAPRDRKSVV